MPLAHQLLHLRLVLLRLRGDSCLGPILNQRPLRNSSRRLPLQPRSGLLLLLAACLVLLQQARAGPTPSTRWGRRPRRVSNLAVRPWPELSLELPFSSLSALQALVRLQQVLLQRAMLSAGLPRRSGLELRGSQHRCSELPRKHRLARLRLQDLVRQRSLDTDFKVPACGSQG